MTREELLSALLSAEEIREGDPGCFCHEFAEFRECATRRNLTLFTCAEYRQGDVWGDRAERLLSALRREGVTL